VFKWHYVTATPQAGGDEAVDGGWRRSRLQDACFVVQRSEDLAYQSTADADANLQPAERMVSCYYPFSARSNRYCLEPKSRQRGQDPARKISNGAGSPLAELPAVSTVAPNVGVVAPIRRVFRDAALMSWRSSSTSVPRRRGFRRAESNHWRHPQQQQQPVPPECTIGDRSTDDHTAADEQQQHPIRLSVRSAFDPYIVFLQRFGQGNLMRVVNATVDTKLQPPDAPGGDDENGKQHGNDGSPSRRRRQQQRQRRREEMLSAVVATSWPMLFAMLVMGVVMVAMGSVALYRKRRLIVM
jgi:hypothetical protein